MSEILPHSFRQQQRRQQAVAQDQDCRCVDAGLGDDEASSCFHKGSH